MRWFQVSATYTVPSGATATPQGSLKLPGGAASPSAKLPQASRSSPWGEKRWMRWLPVSAT